jgi:hypothetical protein
VAVNEHPVVKGKLVDIAGDLEHHDSPDLDHWLEKQNRYTTEEAIAVHNRTSMADAPHLLGTAFQRRMWMKKYFSKLPFRYLLFFLYNWLWLGAWRAGWVGYVWARLRSDVMRLIQYKSREMELTGRLPAGRLRSVGQPDLRVPQLD